MRWRLERITDEILSGPLADVADGEDALGDCANSSSPFVFFDGGDDGPGLDLRDTSEATNLALGDEGLVSFGADEDEIVAGEDSAPALAFSLDEGICDSSPTQVGKDGGEDGPLTADDPIGEANLPPLDAGDADEEADVAAN